MFIILKAAPVVCISDWLSWQCLPSLSPVLSWLSIKTAKRLRETKPDCQPYLSMMRQVLIISALASLSSAQLCFDALEVAGACTAGTDLGNRVMSALYTCDTGYYGGYARKEGGDQDWHTVLDRRGLERQDNCHDVQEIENDFHMYASCK